MHKITSNDLLLYLFNETDRHTYIAIKRALVSDNSLEKECLELEHSLNEIEQLSLEPDHRCITRIMKSLREQAEVHIL